MKTKTILGLSLLACATLPVSEAAASNYPPSYPVCSQDDTVTTGPFELIKHTYNPYAGYATLTVAYRGYLRDSYADDEINLWVSLNGNDAFVPASAGSYDDAYVFFDSGPRACVWCARDFEGNPSVCDDVVYGQYSSGQWLCQDPTTTEEHVFFWAFDEYDAQNAWDVYVAAEANGQWDSNWGANYYGRFEPVNSCY